MFTFTLRYSQRSVIWFPAMPKRSRSARASPPDGYFRVHCPRCRRRMKIPPEYDGKKCRCPGCNESLLIVIPSLPTQPPSLNGKPGPWVAPIPPANHQSKSIPTPPQPVASPALPPAVPPPLPQPEPPDKIKDFDDAYVRRPITYEPQRQTTPTHAAAGAEPKAVHDGLRLVLRWVVPVLLFIIASLINAAGQRRNPELSPTALVIFALAVLLFFLSDFLARLLTAAWAPTYSCPGCHSVFEAVGRWNCSCGYHDHRDQHVILFRCPMCSGRIGHTNCQRCDATIFLQSGWKKSGRG